VSALSPAGHVAALAGAVAGSFINATAGGGTLVSFPTLTALGLPTITANATNMVAMCPGYFAGTHAQRSEIAALRPTLPRQVVCAALGSLVGAILLTKTDEGVFRRVVPLLILASTVLLAAQPRIRAAVAARQGRADRPLVEGAAVEDRVGLRPLAGLFVASAYGGYFGAGLGIILLAVTGLYLTLSFRQLNALKQLLSVVVGLTSAAFLVFTPHVDWAVAAWMIPGSLLGGALGGRVVGRVNPAMLRTAVVCLSTAVAVVYMWKEWR